MSNLILTVSAIALAGLMVATLVSYVGTDRSLALDMALHLRRDLEQLKKGSEAYARDHHALPASFADLTPEYAFRPRMYGPMTWTLGTLVEDGYAYPGVYVCLAGVPNQALYYMLETLDRWLYPQAYIVGSHCPLLDRGGAVGVPSATPGQTTLAMTYWLRYPANHWESEP